MRAKPRLSPVILTFVVMFYASVALAATENFPYMPIPGNKEDLLKKEKQVRDLYDAMEKMYAIAHEGRYKEAADLAAAALAQAEPYIQDAPWLMPLNTIIGFLYFSSDDLALAVHYFEKSLLYPQQKKEYESFWNLACQYLTYSYIELDEYDQAWKIFNQHLDALVPLFFSIEDSPLFFNYISIANMGIGKAGTAIFFQKMALVRTVEDKKKGTGSDGDIGAAKSDLLDVLAEPDRLHALPEIERYIKTGERADRIFSINEKNFFDRFNAISAVVAEDSTRNKEAVAKELRSWLHAAQEELH